MGSRYDDGYHSPVSRGPPPGARWDSQRFSRESEERYRGPPAAVIERERERSFGYGRGFDDRYAPPAHPAESFDQRYYREEEYGPPARRPERRYYDEDYSYEPRGPPAGGAMIPFRLPRPEAPPRPGLLRRQSSLDTFDRKPLRRYDYDDRDDFRSNPRGPPVIPIPVPPSRSPPRYSRPRYAERDYEDIRVVEPERYGDDEFRAYREREWTRQRSRNRSRSASSSSTEREVEHPKPKTYPRKGKTRMPKRLVHQKVLSNLGYPFHEEGEMIIIEKALGKDNIDEVVTLSREMREREGTSTIHIIKSPPPEEKVTEEIIERKITTVPISEAPESVREWDNLKVESVRSVSPKRYSRSRQSSRSRRDPSPTERIIEKKTIVREVSPTRTSRSRRHSSVHGTEIIERREIIEDSVGQSNPIPGPLALVVDRHPKSERDIKDEIRELEAERDALRYERQLQRSSRYRERGQEVVVARPPAEEVIEIRKDRKGRMSLAVPR